MQANAIPFVGQLGVAYQPLPPVAAPRVAPPAAAVCDGRAEAAPVRAPPPPAEALKPNGPCIVTPVMSEQDLANCAAPHPADPPECSPARPSL